MDVYHKVLLNLYNVTDGKDSLSVDLKELVKNQGFLGNYGDIFQMLSGQGWIAETPKANYVKITHWGVKEIKKTSNDQPLAAHVAKKEATQLVSDVKLLIIMIEEFASNTSVENLAQVEKKLSQINAAIGNLKTSIE
jgi:hypothetical protein